MEKVYKCVFIILVLAMLAACSESGTGTERDESFPFSFVSDDFRYGGFDYPGSWDVTSVAAEVELTYRNEDNPEQNRFSDIPFRYQFIFGRNAEENSTPGETLEEYNESRAVEGDTHRQLYYHTYFEHFATLDISTNGFLYLLADYEETDTWDVNNNDVKVIRQENEWRANWYHGRAYYDLHVKNEAQIDSDEAFQELLEYMID